MLVTLYCPFPPEKPVLAADPHQSRSPRRVVCLRLPPIASSRFLMAIRGRGLRGGGVGKERKGGQMDCLELVRFMEETNLLQTATNIHGDPSNGLVISISITGIRTGSTFSHLQLQPHPGRQVAAARDGRDF